MKKIAKTKKLVVSIETIRLLAVRGGSNGDPPQPPSDPASSPACATDFCSYHCGGGGGSLATCFIAGCETYQSQ